MLKVNYKLLRQSRDRNDNHASLSKVRHNSFYDIESHHEANLTESHGIFIDDYFGFQIANHYEGATNMKDSTNEEWIKSMDTTELADFLSCLTGNTIHVADVSEWLKLPKGEKLVGKI